MIVMGLIGGALWGFIPGFLKARFSVNEIITTLMLNYIAIFWNNFWIFDKWSDAGFQMTPTFEKSAWLPRLAGLCPSIFVVIRYDTSLRFCHCPDRYCHCLVDPRAQQVGL